MTYNPTPFRGTELRRHYFQSLYFDADHVKPLNGKSILFRNKDIMRWKTATKGARALRHPHPAHHSDPISVMCVVEMLMKIDIHSRFHAVELTQLMNEEYKDFIWHQHQVGWILMHIYKAQEKSGAPKFDQWKTLNQQKGVRPHKGAFAYCLYPARETYIWLAKILQRLIDFNYEVIRKERATRSRVNYQNRFPEHILWDKEDPRKTPITAGIVFRQI